MVDDQRDSTDSLAMFLRLRGHEVRTAHDGLGALEEIAHHRPEVVFLDLGLPGMSGYDVARRLRAMPEARDARLVALTGRRTVGRPARPASTSTWQSRWTRGPWMRCSTARPDPTRWRVSGEVA